MLITTYKVTAPNVIEEFIEDLTAKEGQVLVKVDCMAICKADIRYFLGLRSKNVLDHKYPLTPIHEAVGHVIKDYTGKYKKGDKVILVPNSVDPNMCSNCEHKRCSNPELGNNYCPYASFKSSTKDGFLKPFCAVDELGLVKYNNEIPSEIAVWSELLSVSTAAARRIGIQNNQKVAVFGDGIMAFLVYLVLYYQYNCDISVFGMSDDKLAMFKHAKTYKFKDYKGSKFDTLIECVGGRFAQDAINQMIDIATVGADLLLMGVSEDNSAINTRKVLEKGLSIKGVTRSSYDDFVKVSKLIENKEIQKDLKEIVLSENIIKTVTDIYKVFDLDVNNTSVIGKNVMKW